MRNEKEQTILKQGNRVVHLYKVYGEEIKRRLINRIPLPFSGDSIDYTQNHCFR